MLTVTRTGRAIARSGLLPITANELLSYVSRNAPAFAQLILDCAERDLPECDDFAFLMIHAALSCSEFGGQALGARRYIPYQLSRPPLTGPQNRVRHLMFSPSQDDALNGAILATRWIGGGRARDIERVFDVRSGVLSALFGDAANILRGLADICYAVTAPQDMLSLPESVDPDAISNMTKIVGSLRQVATRLDAGLPEDVLWMLTVRDEDGPVLSRAQCMALRTATFLSPAHILDAGRFPQLLAALGAPSNTTRTLAQKLQQRMRSWRLAERDRLMASQEKRLPVACHAHLRDYYRSDGKAFERVLDGILECLGIGITARDDGTQSSFPDLVTSSLPPGDTAIECKSKTLGDSVSFNDATDVIRKAAVNGLGHAFKVTVCQPYVSPDVARKLVKCAELAVVNAEDLAEALVRVRVGKMTVADLSDWLHRPGQALREMLPSNVVTIT